MILKPRHKPGVADVSDLSKDSVVRWQHRWYVWLIIGYGFILPTVVAGLGWGDWKGGFLFAGAARLCFVHHVRDMPYSPICLRVLTVYSVHLLRQLARTLARRDSVRRQAHATRPLRHRPCDHRRGLPQFPPPVPDGLSQRYQVVSVRPDEMVHLGVRESWSREPPEGLLGERSQERPAIHAAQEAPSDPGWPGLGTRCPGAAGC